MARRRDPKEDALAATRCLNPHPEQVTEPDHLASDFFDARDAVQVKYEMERKVKAGGAPVTETTAAFGYSRPAYYAAAAALESAGLEGLVPPPPRPPRRPQPTRRGAARPRRLPRARGGLPAGPGRAGRQGRPRLAPPPGGPRPARPHAPRLAAGARREAGPAARRPGRRAHQRPGRRRARRDSPGPLTTALAEGDPMLPDTVASKVTAAHLSRQALLYVRQSSLKQVTRNTESAIRQYDLRGKAIALGWDASQVTVIDIDQGHSGASAADREGLH